NPHPSESAAQKWRRVSLGPALSQGGISEKGRFRGAADCGPSYAPWHFLYFFPLPQGQGSLRPTLSSVRWTVWGGAGSSPLFKVSLGCGWETIGGGGSGAGLSFRTAWTRNNRSSASDLMR